MYMRYVKMERGGSQTRSNNTAATIGWILMTLPALTRDNRNGFIHFTYTPRDLNLLGFQPVYISFYIKAIKNIRYCYSYHEK